MAARHAVRGISQRENRIPERISYRTYVDGNTVRKVDVQVKPRSWNAERHADRKVQRQRVHGMSIGYVAFLAVTMGLVLFGCVWYLQVQAQMTAAINSINSKEGILNELKAENDAEYDRVTSSVDLENIRDTAINELGMVYASEDQVVLYSSEDSDYVVQYQDIPEAEENAGIESKVAAWLGR